MADVAVSNSVLTDQHHREIDACLDDIKAVVGDDGVTRI